MHASRLHRVVAVGLVAAAMGLLAAPSATANWIGKSGQAGDCGIANMPDNRNVYFHYVAADPELKTTGEWVRVNLVAPTALTTHYSSDLTELTDVVGRDRYYDSWCEAELGMRWTTDGYYGTLGLTTCNRLSPSRRCEQATYRISRYVWDNRGQTFRRNISCHEIGHALGLLHRSNTGGCMPATNNGANAYTTHDKNHWEVFSEAYS